ncbi:hypothetical protein [Bacillus subtilis]|uniref:hypothetical protein n=1 Tax=Bacillus subtilis TaxID=1423 RepID=UPI00059CFBA5|nr:hypothetical protein [Bacillus subtilis]KIN36211.1 hypothetical protein B4070_4370 [Bacillus subtilis]MCB4341571.1 hypothetical protein [Bacillus subtilis]
MKILVIKTNKHLKNETKEAMRVEVERAIETGVMFLDGGLELETVEVDEFKIVDEPVKEEKSFSQGVISFINDEESILTFRKANPQLLKIELDDIDSVPRVYYKGEQIKEIINTDFSYLTNTELINPTHIDIEYMDADSKFGTKAIVHNRHLVNERD